MPKYLWSGSYTAEGIKALMAEGGTARRTAISRLADSLGGRLDAMYFSFGSSDVFAIFDMPDNVTAAAVQLAVGSSGSIQGGVTVLITPEELDAATRKAPVYRPPGS